MKVEMESNQISQLGLLASEHKPVNTNSANASLRIKKLNYSSREICLFTEPEGEKQVPFRA